jgi:hypothetical protein
MVKSNSSLLVGFLKLPELLGPRNRGRVAHAILGHEGALARHPVLRTDVGIRVAATTSLLFGIVRIEWCVKYVGISHWSRASEFPAKGAVLEGGEEGVQCGEVGALHGLLALDGFDDGGEFLLEGQRGTWDCNFFERGFFQNRKCCRSPGFRYPSLEKR